MREYDGRARARRAGEFLPDVWAAEQTTQRRASSFRHMDVFTLDAAARPVWSAPAVTRTSITVRCFESFDEAAFLRNEVDALNRVSVHPDPFSTFAFFETYFRHDELHPPGRDSQLWFLTAFRGAQLIGYLALRQVTHKVLGRPVCTVGLLVVHDTDRPHLVARPEHQREVSEAFYAHLLGRRAEWSCLEFAQQDSTSALFPPPAAVARKGWLVREWPSLENCTIPVSWLSLVDYFAALPKKYRTNLGRQLRKLLDAGEVELLGSSDPATTPALFELCLGLEAQSWKAEAQAGIARHPERVAYFRALLGADQPMRLTIQVLLIDGLPVAGIVCGAFDRSVYALHVVYDERWNALAPGSAMLLMGMRQAIDGGCDSFNLMSGFGYYKARWLAQATPTRVGQIYRVGSLLYWRRVFGDMKRRLWPRRAAGEAQRFNPARREIETGEAGPRDRPPATPEAQARVVALIAQARAGAGEFLSGDALAAVMPIDLRRAAGVKRPRGSQGGLG